MQATLLTGGNQSLRRDIWRSYCVLLISIGTTQYRFVLADDLAQVDAVPNIQVDGETLIGINILRENNSGVKQSFR